MQSKTILLELVPGRMTVAVVEGSRLRDVARRSFAVESDPNSWVRALRQLASQLSTIVVEHGLAGRSTVVLYNSPTSAVDLHGSTVTSPAAAAESALLSSADSLPYSSLSALQQAVVIGRDTRSESRQHHVLVAAEREDIAAAIVELVEQAGLKYEAAAPIDAFVLSRMAGQALKCADETQGYLYVGEHSSFFIVGGGGRIDFERRLSFDIEAMVTTLRRPILRGTGADGEQSSIELKPDEARQVVYQHGIPDRDAIVYDPLKLTGTQVIPLLQPLLQRLVVELRQSIRFGVSEKDRRQIPIIISGPGVCIPGLAETVGNELGQSVTADESWTAFNFAEATCPCGELVRAQSMGRLVSRINLQPRELADRRRNSRMKRWLWTGAAAALVVIGFDYLQYDIRLTDAQQSADMLSMSAGDIDALRQTSEKLQSTIGALKTVESTIESEIGMGVSFRAMMNEVSRLTPPTVKLTSLNFVTVDDGVVANISGYVFSDEGVMDEQTLQNYVGSLRSSPLFDDVNLGNVQIGSMAGMDGRRFDARATVVAAPWQAVDDRLASAPSAASTGGAP